MRITIDTKILERHSLTIGEFLIMLIGYYEIDLESCLNSIINKALGERNLFKNMNIILSNNTKDLIAQILMESNEKIIQSDIDFEQLAIELMNCYPEGNKSGTTHSWRSTVNVIAQKLRVLVAIYNFTFTPEEAVEAVKSYLSSYGSLDQHTLTLKHFLLKTTGEKGDSDINSLFMTYIENGREQ